MPVPPFQIQGLGEVAIRCRQLSPMVEFYRDVLGLELLPGEYSPNIVFFRIADGVAGHTTVLALFEEPDSLAETSPSTASANSTLHHLALGLTWHEQQKAISWYEQQGIMYEIRHFEWIGWRGVFTPDPEGNIVELVAAVPASTAEVV